MSADARDEALTLARLAIDAAASAGAADADAAVSIADRFSAEARNDAITKLEQARSRALTLRVFLGGRRATMTTTDLTEGGLRALATRLVAAAGFVAEDPHAGLPDDTAPPGGDPGLVADDVLVRPAEAKADDALALERAIRAGDGRVDNSQGSRAGDTAATIALANTRGFAGAYRTTQAQRSTAPVARDGDHKRIGYYGTAARGWSGCEDVATVARHALWRATALFGARKPPTGRMAVIFERDVAGAVLADVFQALSAANVVAGNSWLADRIGDTIGSEHVTIVDDGRLAEGLNAAPFDGEGVATRRTVCFERGRLASYLADTYYGRRLGIASTGNSSGAGVGATNLALAPGRGSLDDLVASTADGVLILDTIGFATEYASGTYSRGARGIRVRDGAFAEPVDEFTIASTFPEMLAAVDAVAADLRYDGGIVAPSFRVAEMTVSGG